MFTLLIFSIKKKFKSNLSTVLILIAGIVVSILCINVLIGYAKNQYVSERGTADYSSVTINVDSSLGSQEFNTYAESITEQYKGKIDNALYIKELNDGTVLIGWQGYSPSHWFPTASSRFFNEEENANSEKVVYMSMNDCEYKYDDNGNVIDVKEIKYKEGETYTIDSEIYTIIGIGWYVPYNFYRVVSDESVFNPFEDNNKKIIILPYSTFLEKYHPQLMLIQFNDVSYADLTNICDTLNKTSIGIAMLPKYNSDNMLAEKKLQRAIVGGFLAIIAGFTIIQILSLWLSDNKKQYEIYRICGLSKIKAFFIVAVEWLICIVVGTIFAVIINCIAIKPLSMLDAGYLPDIGDIVLTMVVVYLATLLASSKKIEKILNISRTK